MKKIENSIAALVITYNEKENIEECLKSINWVNEIILVDSYSTDNTVDLAKKYTKNIFLKKFNQDYSEQRNYALRQIPSSIEWILVIDADESLASNAKEEIQKLMRENNETDGYWVPRRNYIDSKRFLRHGLFYPDYQLRLLKNTSTIKYNGRVHEEPQIEKSKTKEISNFYIHHNHTHTKYNSFISILRMRPYIRIESEYIEASKQNNLQLTVKGVQDVFRYFYSSCVLGKGYKDGYIGFRAALIFSIYRGAISFRAVKMRLLKRWHYAKK